MSATDSAYTGSEISESDDDYLNYEYVFPSEDSGYPSSYESAPGADEDPDLNLVVHVYNANIVYENSDSDSENFATSSDEEQRFNWHKYWAKQQREVNSSEDVWYDVLSESETEWYDAEEGQQQ